MTPPSSSSSKKSGSEKGVLSNIGMKIRKHTLNMVQGKSKQRNPFYYRQIVRVQALEACVVIRIPYEVLEMFGTMR
jgi:hypothetical protein